MRLQPTLPKHGLYSTTHIPISSCTTRDIIGHTCEYGRQGLRNLKRTLLDGGYGTSDIGPSVNSIGRNRCFGLLKKEIRPSGRPRLCRLNAISPYFPLSLLYSHPEQADEKQG